MQGWMHTSVIIIEIGNRQKKIRNKILTCQKGMKRRIRIKTMVKMRTVDYIKSKNRRDLIHPLEEGLKALV